MDIMQSVEKVNDLLQAGEPGNITKADTNGYMGYEPQSIIDAMNEGFGIGNWGFEEVSSETVDNEKGTLAVAHMSVWLKGIDFKPTSWGQSRVTRGDTGDAKKGAQTDAIKKGLAYFSIGNRAYHGLLDGKKQPPRLQPPIRPVPPVQQASNEDQRLADAPVPPTKPIAALPVDTLVPEAPSIRDLQKRCNELFGVGFWQAMLLKALKIENMDIVIKNDDLTADDRLNIASYMDRQAKAKRQKAS